MNTKTIAFLRLKVIALGVILTACFMVASRILGVSTPPPGVEPPPVDPSVAMLALLLSSLLQTILLAYLILRSGWGSWKLVAAVFLAFCGPMSVLAQTDSPFSVQLYWDDMIPKLLVMDAIVAGLFSPLAVLILGKIRRELASQGPNLRLVMPPSEWAWKLAAMATAYVILDFTFDYLLAWYKPAIKEHYAWMFPDEGSRVIPWMALFLALRAMLFVTLVLPVIRMLKGQPWEIGLAIGLLFSIGSTQLLFPHPGLPQAVARAHLLKTVSLNLTFGLLVGWLLSRHHSSLRDLFRTTEAVRDSAAKTYL